MEIKITEEELKWILHALNKASAWRESEHEAKNLDRIHAKLIKKYRS